MSNQGSGKPPGSGATPPAETTLKGHARGGAEGQPPQPPPQPPPGQQPQPQGGWPQPPQQQPQPQGGWPQPPQPQGGWPQQPPQQPQQQGWPPQQPQQQPQQQGWPQQQPQQGWPQQQPQQGWPQQPQQHGGWQQPPAYPPPPSQPYPQPSSQPYPQPPAYPPPAISPPAYPPPPDAPGTQPAPNATMGDSNELKRSAGRAFRLRIEPHEITPKERTALLSANPPILDPHMMAFLAWRRSILLLVAIALIPLAGLRVWDSFKDDFPSQLRFITLVPACAEVFLCLVCWYQLKNWSHWRQQRRALFKAWVIFMAAPFIVFLVPMDSIVESIVREQMGAGADVAFEAGALDNQVVAQAVIGIKAAIAISALLMLAPKAVSLLAGSVRAGIVTKMLFPGTSGPGWIVVLAAPLYTLFVFTLLIVPYQLTGSGWYLGAMVGLLAAQIALGRAGYKLAKPMSHEDAVGMVRKARATYLIAMLAFAVCLVAAMGQLAKQLGVETIVTTVLSFETNVLLLTLIGSDLVITNLERARGLSTGTANHLEDSNKKLSAFVGSE